LSSGCTVQGNAVDDGGSGIDLEVDYQNDTTIDGNTFAGNGFVRILADAQPGPPPLFAYFAPTNVDVTNNAFTGTGSSGFDLLDQAASGAVSGNSFNGTGTAAVLVGVLPVSADTGVGLTAQGGIGTFTTGTQSLHDNNFTGWTGADVQDYLAAYTFANGGAGHTFAAAVNASGIETDVLTGYQSGDKIAVGASVEFAFVGSGPDGYGVAILFQNRPDEVDVLLNNAFDTPTQTGDEIKVESLSGLTATQVANSLGVSTALIDTGPVAGTLNQTVVAGSTNNDLTSAIQAQVAPGPAGGGNIVDIGPPTLGSDSLSGGVATYSAVAATAANESTLLGEIESSGNARSPGHASDSFTYTVQDQYGVPATGTVNLTLAPTVIAGTTADHQLVSGVAGATDVIVALGLADTINANGNDVVYGQQSSDTYNVTAGLAAILNLTGNGNTVTGTAMPNEWITATGGSSNNNVNMGNGTDNVSLSGDNNSVTLGNGNNDSVSVGGKANTLTLGSGTGDKIAMGSSSTGGDVFTLNDSGANLVLHGAKNVVSINGSNGVDTITDSLGSSDKLTLRLGAAGGTASIANFSLTHGLLDLAGGLGFGSTQAIANYVNTHSDGFGGSSLIYNGGSIDFLGIAPGSFHASNFSVA
jgi:hypothetical protein